MPYEMIDCPLLSARLTRRACHMNQKNAFLAARIIDSHVRRRAHIKESLIYHAMPALETRHMSCLRACMQCERSHGRPYLEQAYKAFRSCWATACSAVYRRLPITDAFNDIHHADNRALPLY